MRMPEQSDGLHKRSRTRGQIRVTLPMRMENGVLWLRPSDHARIKRLVASVKKLLRAFGPFRLDSKVFPECGSIVVSVLDATTTRDAIFDATAFDRYCINIALLAQLRRKERRERTEESRQALQDVMDALADVDVTAIEKILQDMEREGGVQMGSPDGPPVQIGLPDGRGVRKPGAASDHLDIEVISITRLAHVVTDQGRDYLVDDIAALDFQRGDAFRIREDSEDGVVTCSIADAAVPAPEQLDLVLESRNDCVEPEAAANHSLECVVDQEPAQATQVRRPCAVKRGLLPVRRWRKPHKLGRLHERVRKRQPR